MPPPPGRWRTHSNPGNNRSRVVAEQPYLGRAQGGWVEIRAGHARQRGTRANRDLLPPGYLEEANQQAGSTIIARGHLLARSLGGTGDDARNIVTICQKTTNLRWHAEIEDEIRSMTEFTPGECYYDFYYEVRAHYTGTNGIPDALRVRACGREAKNGKPTGNWYRTTEDVWVRGIYNAPSISQCETKNRNP